MNRTNRPDPALESLREVRDDICIKISLLSGEPEPTEALAGLRLELTKIERQIREREMVARQGPVGGR